VEEKRELEAAPGILAKVVPVPQMTAYGSFTVMVDRTFGVGVPPTINPWLLAAPELLAGIWTTDRSLIVIVDAIEGREADWLQRFLDLKSSLGLLQLGEEPWYLVDR